MKNLHVAVLIGLVVTAPFFILESITTSGFAESSFPLILFISMWTFASLFSFILLPIIKDIRTKKKTKEHFLVSLLKGFLLFVFASMWLTLVQDQWPCFLGGRGC